MKIEIALHCIALLAAVINIGLMPITGPLVTLILFAVTACFSWLALFLQRRRHTRDDAEWRKRWGL